ncbi:helix-turn-helix domain-containing protein [Aequorivita sp. SDUM287046]|uniref:Helix-turn-helix domain-containing protein n=1 Tax=Aequorivita aurantiaca TaxID=3053356 RepID=A0ABT8DNN6_9FLAO|nr:helix-turn-helix domain-containing protein [Aequorivita aurantiaca]MDN3724687.1 helix-turn-helix domain-containing protein [Aequorivita aurantiaca]
MRFYFLIFFIAQISINSNAQDFGDYKNMLSNAEAILYTQPQAAIKIANHVLENSANKDQRVQAHLLNTVGFYITGNFENAVKAGVQAKVIAESTKNLPLQLRATVTSIPILMHLGLDVVAQQYYINTIVLATAINNEDAQKYIYAGKALLEANKNLQEDNWQQASEQFNLAKTNFEKIPDPVMAIETTVSIAEIFLKRNDTTASKEYFENLLAKTGGEHPNNYLEMVLRNQMGNLYFIQKNYEKALESYQTALKIATQFENHAYQAQISENLSSVYLALKNSDQFYAFKKEAQQLDTKTEIAEDQGVNAIYNYVNTNHTTKTETLKKNYAQNIWIFSAILGFIIILGLLLRFRYRSRFKQYQKFIAYNENRERPTEELPTKEISKGLNIPVETENLLVKKLAHFENSKQFTKQDMSLALLAAHLDTNTKYLSEVINTHKGKNFNSYINELRINYIIDKLKNNRTYLQYKISYLAEESGFSSHSSFATVFKSVTGISPTVFIDLLKSSKKSPKHVYEEVE